MANADKHPGIILMDAWDKVTTCFFEHIQGRLLVGEYSKDILPELKSFLAFNDIVSDVISDSFNSHYPWNRNGK